MSLALRTPCTGIATARFSLRPLQAGDEVLYQDIYCDPETMRYVGAPLSAGQAARSFRAAIRQTADPQAKVRFLVAVDKASGITLGICGATLGVPRLGSAEIGIMFTKSARKQGFSHDVFAGFVQYVFATFNVEQLWSEYSTENSGAHRLVLSLGFDVNAATEVGKSLRGMRRAYLFRENWQSYVESNNKG